MRRDDAYLLDMLVPVLITQLEPLVPPESE